MFTGLSVRALLVVTGIRDRVAKLCRSNDAGYSTEATVVIALLAAAAIVIVGIIVAKVTARAKSIDL